MPSNLESSVIRHAEVGDDDVIRAQFRSDVGHGELAHYDAAAIYRPVLLSTQQIVSIMQSFFIVIIMTAASVV